MAIPKKHHKKFLVGGILGLTLLMVIIYIVKHRSQAPATNTKAPGTGPSSFTDTADPAKQLRKGDKGNSVIALQKQLNVNAVNPLTADGMYGNATQAEVQRQMSGNPKYAPLGTISVNDLIAWNTSGGVTVSSPPPDPYDVSGSPLSGGSDAGSLNFSSTVF